VQRTLHPVVRAVTYVVAATALAVVVGWVRSGTLGGGVALGIAAAVGVSVGLLGFELIDRSR
jgi:uncharacterized membrane protein